MGHQATGQRTPSLSDLSRVPIAVPVGIAVLPRRTHVLSTTHHVFICPSPTFHTFLMFRCLSAVILATGYKLFSISLLFVLLPTPVYVKPSLHRVDKSPLRNLLRRVRWHFFLVVVDLYKCTICQNIGARTPLCWTGLALPADGEFSFSSCCRMASQGRGTK